MKPPLLLTTEGYWNNKAEFSNPLIPDYKINPNTGEYIITGTSREPSTTSVQRTLLSRVTLQADIQNLSTNP
jgi:hypothetical protein